MPPKQHRTKRSKPREFEGFSVKLYYDIERDKAVIDFIQSRVISDVDKRRGVEGQTMKDLFLSAFSVLMSDESYDESVGLLTRKDTRELAQAISQRLNIQKTDDFRDLYDDVDAIGRILKSVADDMSELRTAIESGAGMKAKPKRMSKKEASNRAEANAAAVNLFGAASYEDDD
jgi:hypothetical protein